MPSKGIDYQIISEKELVKISSLKSPNKTLAVFHIPDPVPLRLYVTGFWLLDGVKDPGNLGTIIRLCDWFGIKHLVCSTDTVDCFNPKVLQATMGSIARVNTVYTNLDVLIEKSDVPVLGAFMEGESVYELNWPSRGMLIMGNEAHGISKKLELMLHKKVSIPQYGKASAESLNVATATAILLNELRRN